MARWHPMASMVITVPLNSSASSSFGMAVISLDFSSTLRCASTRPLLFAQAETICTMAFFPGSEAPRSDLPSMATTSPAVNLAIDDTQATKPFSNASGSSAEKTRLNVSIERIVRRDTAGKSQKTLEPQVFGVTIVLDLVPTVATAQNRRYGHQKDLFQ